MKYEEISNRMNTALDNAHITASELSIRADIKEASISQYVNGVHKPSNINAGKMAEVLKVNPLWLMGFDVPMRDDIISGIQQAIDALPSASETISRTFPNLTSEEWEHIKTIRQLNEEGQERVFTYATDLYSTGRYAKKNNENPLVDKS